MPFVRRFYYMPRVSDPNNGTDIPSPVDNLWKPGGSSDIKYDFHPGTMRQQSFQDLPVEVQLKQLYHKKILGILNKVTPKKFEQLISEVGYECRDLTFIKMMAEMIFVKTLEDEIYVLMYAKFCNGIMDNLHTDCRACLRDTLYNLCETGCQHLLTFRDEDISSIDEDIRFVFKRKLMTLVRFIGEMSFINNPLFNHEYSLNLTEKLFDAGDELHLEAIYFILCTCAFRDNGIKWPDSLWVTVAELAKGVNPSGAFVSARIRFMFLSLAEARIGLVLLDPYSPHNSPSASDSENNDMLPDSKGF